MRHLWEIIEHIAAMALVIAASKLLEKIFGHDLMKSFENNKIFDNIIIVVLIVTLYFLFKFIIRYIKFLRSQTSKIRGFYIQQFHIDSNEYISIYRAYASFWAGGRGPRLIGRCYEHKDGKYTMAGQWESSGEVRFMENEYIYLYNGSFKGEPSHGVARMDIENKMIVSGYFYDLEGGIEKHGTTKRITYNATLINKTKFIKNVIPSAWNRIRIINRNTIIRTGKYLDIYMDKTTTGDLSNNKFISKDGQTMLKNTIIRRSS